MSITLTEIQKRLKLQLPGENAHIPMSPSGRGRSSEAIKNAINYRKSAVALVIYENKSELKGVLTERSPYAGFHSGEICLPGGKKEEFDQDLVETAVRECVEETGLIHDHFSFMGELTPVFIPISNFSIQPYVFHYLETPVFTPNPREVAEIFTFPLTQLLEKNAIKKTNIEIYGNKTLNNIPYFDINNKVVWGATALILHEFKELLEKKHFDL
ncbi:coenzyme A pyrophosphatase [Brumimicrobium salinarum]|uniref:Coenzyme A pyrophosphatase n=1 Tax=Brumimicrobium salinarum TaxID=2058658 RepID=A0A2I0R0M0_9FLAO|nr:CoA pyrophosphatase [Brumimicrobium salinarum]PKR80123.1 coenzyme A pyrophosphatase [Brumimicrobium salinarum]